MRLGISTATMHEKAYTEDALTMIGGMGVHVAEAFLETRCEYNAEFATELKARADACGVSITAVHPMAMQFEPQLFSKGIRQREDAFETFEQVLASAKLLGADKYVMHGMAAIHGARMMPPAARIAPVIDEAAETAKKYGVKLCFENVSWCMFSRPEFASELLKNIKSDNLGFTLDIKQASRSGRSPYEYIETMGERLSHLHICDYVADDSGRMMYTLRPGKGKFDFTRLAETLYRRGYTGDVIVELYSSTFDTLEQLSESCEWVKLCMGL